MTTTRCYGNWTNRVSPYNSTLEAEVAQALDTYEPTEAVLDAVCAAYREAINAALPPGVVLAGNEFYGPADAECPPLDVILDGIDFWALAEPVLEAHSQPWEIVYAQTGESAMDGVVLAADADTALRTAADRGAITGELAQYRASHQ